MNNSIMQYSPEALILAGMFDQLDGRGQDALFALARSELEHIRREQLHAEYCSDPNSAQSDTAVQNLPDPTRP